MTERSFLVQLFHCGTDITTMMLGLMWSVVAGFSWSWGPLGWLVPSEVHTIETRSPAQGITVCINFLASFLVGQVYLTMLCK